MVIFSTCAVLHMHPSIAPGSVTAVQLKLLAACLSQGDGVVVPSGLLQGMRLAVSPAPRLLMVATHAGGHCAYDRPDGQHRM
jgi:hypothetical protein